MRPGVSGTKWDPGMRCSVAIPMPSSNIHFNVPLQWHVVISPFTKIQYSMMFSLEAPGQRSQEGNESNNH